MNSLEYDGATGVKAAFKITIPLILPTIKTCAIFVITGSLKAFDMIYVLTNGLTGKFYGSAQLCNV